MLRRYNGQISRILEHEHEQELSISVMLVLVALLGVHGPLVREAVVATALPSAVIAPMLATQYKTYQAGAGSSMVLTILLMMVVVPLFLLIIH